MAKPKGARNRTPEEIAIEQVEVEERKVQTLTVRHDRLLEEIEKVQIDLVGAQRRRDYRLMNPDLPEDYEPVGHKKTGEPEPTKEGAGE